MREMDVPRILGPFLALGMITLGALGIAYLAGKKGPHNYRFSGTVMSEREIYGNALVGYSTEREGVKGFIEKNLHEITRPGPPMRLYSLVPEKVEYDTRKWFKTIHHVEETTKDLKDLETLTKGNKDLVVAIAGFHIQTNGDIADEGDKFSFDAGKAGRLSYTFALRGIRYTYQNSDGEEEVIEVHNVLKNPTDIHFEKP